MVSKIDVLTSAGRKGAECRGVEPHPLLSSDLKETPETMIEPQSGWEQDACCAVCCLLALLNSYP